MPSLCSATYDLESLYHSHSPWLREWLSRHAKCRVRAADLVQDTFCRLAELPELRLHAHPRRYLATVARRLLIDETRREATERHFLDAYALHMHGMEQPGPDRIAEAVEQLMSLASLLDELPAKARRAFLLSRVDGLGYSEIAADLGVSKSMVKQYVARCFAHCYVVAHGCAD